MPATQRALTSVPGGRPIGPRTARTGAKPTIVPKTEKPTGDPARPGPKVMKLVDALKAPFKAYLSAFTALTETRASLAPKFEKAFITYREETGGSFVAFVHLFDPTVPLDDRDAYRAHRTYQAATYLRRLVNQPTGGAVVQVPPGKRPATILHAFARFIATVLPTVDDAKHTIWETFVHEMKWNDRQAGNLFKLSERLGPIQLPAKIVRKMTA